MSKSRYVIGIDFGTDSVRSVIVDVSNGEEISTHVSYFKRWAEGLFCSPEKNEFRQHPLDHIESLEDSIVGALKKVNPDTGDNRNRDRYNRFYCRTGRSKRYGVGFKRGVF